MTDRPEISVAGANGRLRQLWEDESDVRTKVQMLARIVLMLVRGIITISTRTWPPVPVLRARRVRLVNSHKISFGRWCVLEEGVEIQGRSTRGIIIGESVSIGRGAQIRPSGFYGRAPGVGLRVGDGANIGPLNYIGCSEMICIGRRVLLGPNVSIFTEWHEFGDVHRSIKDQGVGASAVTIEDDCWIGAGSILLPGVTVGTGSVVAAGSVVVDDVPPGALVAGVPAVQKRVRQ